MVTPVLSVFQQVLSRSAQAARQLLGDNYGGIVVSDRYSAYSWLPLEQRQLCWAHIKRDLTAIAVRRRLDRRDRATTSAGLRTRQQGSDPGLEPRDARPSVVADQGAVHGQTG